MSLSKFAVFCLTLGTGFVAEGTEGKLQWSDHYDNAKQAAQAEMRPTLIVIEDSSIDAVVNEKNLAGKTKDLLLQHDFQLVKVDANTEYGGQVAKAFGAEEFPYMIITNTDSSEIVFRNAGPMTNWDWAFALGKSVDVAANSKSQIEWSEHYDDSKSVAQATKRPLVVVIEDSANDARIDEKNLEGESKDLLAKKNFELVKIDTKTEYGRDVAKAFGAKVFPYTVITNADSSEIIFRKSGQMSKKDWKLALNKCETPNQPVKKSSKRVFVQTPQPVKQVAKLATVALTQAAPVVAVPPMQPVVSAMFSPVMFAPSKGFHASPSATCTAST